MGSNEVGISTVPFVLIALTKVPELVWRYMDQRCDNNERAKIPTKGYTT